MSLFWRNTSGVEKRYNGFTATFSNPPIPLNSQVGTGNGVPLDGSEASLQAVAMWASVDLIASLVSELPVDVLRGSGSGTTTLPTPSYLLDPGGDSYGIEDWTARLLTSYLLRGNAVGDVLEWGGGATGAYPTQVMLYHPDTAYGWYDSDGLAHWRIGGIERTDRNVWHRRVYPVAGRLMGLSPVQQQAATLGLTLSATRFGLRWFEDGAHPSAILHNKERDLSEGQARTAKERFMAALRGSREPAVLDKGWEYQAVQVNPEESQFLETNKFSQAQVARIFGPGMAEILGYESGDSLTYATVEGRSRHLLVYAVNKWISRVERVFTSMLPRGQYARLNRSALLESTTLERWSVYATQLSTGARVINEIRSDEDWSPVAWGDEPWSPVAAPDTGGR